MNWHWIIEKPRSRSELIVTRTVQWAIIIALIIGGIAWINSDHADAAPLAVSQTHAHPRMPAKDQQAWGKKAGHKFDNGKLANSGGREVPGKAKIKLNAFKTKHPNTRPWWKKGLDLGQCMFNSIGDSIFTTAWQALCLTYGENPTFRSINKSITTVRVVCGSAAVLGALKGGGIWGAVKASGGCSFPMAVVAYENWLGRRAHTRPHNGRTS